MALWDELAALNPAGGGSTSPGGAIGPAVLPQQPPPAWVNAERIYSNPTPAGVPEVLQLPRAGSTAGGSLNDLIDLAARSRAARSVAGGAGEATAAGEALGATLPGLTAEEAMAAQFGPVLSSHGLGGFLGKGINTVSGIGEGLTGRALDVGSLFTAGQAISDIPQHHYAAAEKHAAESAALYGIPKILGKIGGPLKSWLAEHFPQLAAGEEEMAAGPDEETFGLAALLPVLALAAPSAYHYLRHHLQAGHAPAAAATAAAQQQQALADEYRNIASQLQTSMDQFYNALSPQVQQLSGAGYKGNEMAALGLLQALAANPQAATGLPQLATTTAGK